MKTPPQNPEAEMGVLSAMILDPNIYDHARLFVSEDDFFKPKHRLIFKAISKLNGDGDMIAIVNALKESGTLDEIGGAGYIAELADKVIPSSKLAVQHSKLVREASKKRQFITEALRMVEDCYNGLSFEYMAAELEKEAFALSSELSGDEAKPIGESVQEAVTRLQKISNGEIEAGIKTGLADLDRMTSGFQPADLIIIAGRPSMGKTALAFNVLEDISRDGLPTAAFSLEMSREALALRSIARATGINSKVIREGRIREDEWPKIAAAQSYFNQLPMYIDDTPALHIAEMRSRARRLVRKHKVGLIMVDYLQLARGDGKNREQEVADISRGLKAMAKELKIPVIGLAQLNRSLEQRPNKKPMLSDLRESGAIEQDADVICFIYRDEVYNKEANNPKKGITELIIGKQRQGPTGTVELGWDEQTTSFRNLEFNHREN